VSTSRLLPGLLLALLSACETTPIEVRDHGAFTPGGRVVWHPRQGEGASASWFGLELDGSRVEGDDTQELLSGESIVLDGVTISGPAHVAIDYRLSQASLAAVIAQDIRVDAGLRFLFGAAWQEVELELDSGTQQAEGAEDWLGPLLGLEARWSPGGWWGLSGRGTWTADLDDIESEMRLIELGVLFAPRRVLGLFAGWRWVDLERFVPNESDIDLRTDGPSLGLRVEL
jgi:hypothetical protein